MSPPIESHTVSPKEEKNKSIDIGKAHNTKDYQKIFKAAREKRQIPYKNKQTQLDFQQTSEQKWKIMA